MELKVQLGCEIDWIGLLAVPAVVMLALLLLLYTRQVIVEFLSWNLIISGFLFIAHLSFLFQTLMTGLYLVVIRLSPVVKHGFCSIFRRTHDECRQFPTDCIDSKQRTSNMHKHWKSLFSTCYSVVRCPLFISWIDHDKYYISEIISKWRIPRHLRFLIKCALYLRLNT